MRTAPLVASCIETEEYTKNYIDKYGTAIMCACLCAKYNFRSLFKFYRLHYGVAASNRAYSAHFVYLIVFGHGVFGSHLASLFCTQVT